MQTIPVEEIIRGSDEIRAREDWTALGTYLEDWCQKARECGDRRGQLSIMNELLGYYRLQRKEELALSTFAECVRLVFELEQENTAGGCMVLMNAATVLIAFNRKKQALELFLQVQMRMEKILNAEDIRLAGLYNNIAGVYVALANTASAEAYFLKSAAILEKIPVERINLPIIYLNLATLYEKCGGVKNQRRCDGMIARAMEIFDAENAEYDMKYAYNCRKCASAMAELGRADLQQDLNGRADALYDGN